MMLRLGSSRAMGRSAAQFCARNCAMAAASTSTSSGPAHELLEELKAKGQGVSDCGRDRVSEETCVM
jgi:hypothetical protein